MLLADHQGSGFPAENGLDRLNHSLVCGHTSGECHIRQNFFALDDCALEISGHCFAEPFENFLRGESLLLGMDHVALGENRAASGNLGGPFGAADNLADLLDLKPQAAGLLVEKSAGSGRAVPIGRIICNTKVAA